MKSYHCLHRRLTSIPNKSDCIETTINKLFFNEKRARRIKEGTLLKRVYNLILSDEREIPPYFKNAFHFDEWMIAYFGVDVKLTSYVNLRLRYFQWMKRNGLYRDSKIHVNPIFVHGGNIFFSVELDDDK